MPNIEFIEAGEESAAWQPKTLHASLPSAPQLPSDAQSRLRAAFTSVLSAKPDQLDRAEGLAVDLFNLAANRFGSPVLSLLSRLTQEHAGHPRLLKLVSAITDAVCESEENGPARSATQNAASFARGRDTGLRNEGLR